MGPKPHVLIADASIHPAGIDLLQEAATTSKLPAYAPEEALVAAARDADAILARTATISAPVVAAAPRLRVVSRHGVGLDYVDVAACTRRGVLVTTTGDANAQAVSEQAFALLLGVARKVALADAQIRSGRWAREQMVGLELHRKVLGIVGLGRIGSRVARHAQGFEMEVLACDPYIPEAQAHAAGAAPVDLQTLLRRADYISLHVPLNEETRHMIGAAELQQMKPSAVLVNTARGPIVDQDALYEALRYGRIAGAGLDVFEEEPLPAHCPLTQLENIVCSPHCAGQTQEAMVRVSVRAAENVLCVLRGELPPPSLVANPEALERLAWTPKG
jgi:D-3-phosphoglycerate dehydrogenase